MAKPKKQNTAWANRYYPFHPEIRRAMRRMKADQDIPMWRIVHVALCEYLGRRDLISAEPPRPERGD